MTNDHSGTEALLDELAQVTECRRRIAQPSSNLTCEGVTVASRSVGVIGGRFSGLECIGLNRKGLFPEELTKTTQRAPLFERVVENTSVSMIEVLCRLMPEKDARDGTALFAATQKCACIEPENTRERGQLGGRHTGTLRLERLEALDLYTRLGGHHFT